MYKKLPHVTLQRIANRISPEGIIDTQVDGLGYTEEGYLAQEVILLRELAEKMARLLEINAEDDLGQTTKYREEYPKENNG